MIFYVFLLLPSLALAFGLLSTFYGPTRAYYGLAWVPLALFILAWLFQQSFAFQKIADPWTGKFLLAVGWTSLVQAIMGAVLTARAYHRGKGMLGLLTATGLVVIPFFFRS